MLQFEAEAEEDQVPAPWYRKRSLWVYWLPAILSLCLLVIGVVMVVFYHTIKLIYFEVGHRSVHEPLGRAEGPRLFFFFFFGVSDFRGVTVCKP